MTIRTTLTDATRKARMMMSRATIREVSDDHLMQEVKQADVYHSETPSDFERWQMVGFTSVPIKQQTDPNQKTGTKPAEGEEGDWNHDQPTGPAAEAIMLYINGQRSHPIALVDDRRVRPYGMSEGESAAYAVDGSEQMVLFKANGTYIVSLDGTSVSDSKTQQTRFASLRHVNKSMQSHKIDSSSSGNQSNGSAQPSVSALSSNGGNGSSQSQQKYKHEGDTVNTEVRSSKNRIEFYNGDKLVGWYDKSSNVWTLQEVGGNLQLILDGNKIIAQYGDSGKSFQVNSSHVHMKHSGNAIFVDATGCWSTGPINIKADPT